MDSPIAKGLSGVLGSLGYGQSGGGASGGGASGGGASGGRMRLADRLMRQ